MIETVQATFALQVFVDMANVYDMPGHEVTNAKIERSIYRKFTCCPGRRDFGLPESDSDESAPEEERVYHPIGRVNVWNVPWLSAIAADGNPMPNDEDAALLDE